MISLALSILVPIALYIGLPPLCDFFKLKGKGSSKLLIMAGIIYFISWYLPSPDIEGRDTSFVTHLVGGGIFSGFVWLYLKERANQKLSWLAELITLYALVSALGVANELFEFAMVQLGFIELDPSDTWWDLVANTSGALLFWIFYKLRKD